MPVCLSQDLSCNKNDKNCFSNLIRCDRFRFVRRSRQRIPQRLITGDLEIPPSRRLFFLPRPNAVWAWLTFSTPYVSENDGASLPRTSTSKFFEVLYFEHLLVVQSRKCTNPKSLGIEDQTASHHTGHAHRILYSSYKPEADSNFGFSVPFWDKTVRLILCKTAFGAGRHGNRHRRATRS